MRNILVTIKKLRSSRQELKQLMGKPSCKRALNKFEKLDVDEEL